MSKANLQNGPLSMHHTNPLIMKKFSQFLSSNISNAATAVVVCIGTDRSTGDALGPLTGYFLKEAKPTTLKVYGTLNKPVHALNLEEYLYMIFDTYENPFIIAIDASLGRLKSVGHITSDYGPLLPGAALNKQLPEVGHIHLTGVVNVSGMMEYNVLQSTRLSLVYDMAKVLSQILIHVDRRVSHLERPSRSKIKANHSTPIFRINGKHIK